LRVCIYIIYNLIYIYITAGLIEERVRGSETRRARTGGRARGV
jgi:hypothetical protein